ncbi:MAG: FliH/SctL family protein [Bacillota bacterium]
MSRIIKPHEIILQDPVFIQIPDKQTVVKEPQTENDLADAQAEVREEADRIVKETEEMVIEILEKARLEAKNIIADAREEAEEIRLKAEKEAALLKEQAIDHGYHEGWEKAREEARQQIEKARQESEDLVEQAKQERIGIIRSCESIIVRMSMDIAQKIVEKELTTNPDIIIELVKNILDYMNTAEFYKILVNPDDFVTLAAEFGKQSLFSSVNDRIQILADENVSRGGCVVETDLGLVDATLETRVSSLEESLMDVVRND